jgi:hypothetical protein
MEVSFVSWHLNDFVTEGFQFAIFTLVWLFRNPRGAVSVTSGGIPYVTVSFYGTTIMYTNNIDTSCRS